MICLISLKKNISIKVNVLISDKVKSLLIDSATKSSLSGRCLANSSFSSSFLIFNREWFFSNPYVSDSIEYKAFKIDSLKVLPIDIISPTDFIAVFNSKGVPLNFSKLNLGIFVTI